MEWTNVHSCLRDDVLTMANFVNIMETIERDGLLGLPFLGRVVSRNASAGALGVTSARP